MLEKKHDYKGLLYVALSFDFLGAMHQYVCSQCCAVSQSLGVCYKPVAASTSEAWIVYLW